MKRLCWIFLGIFLICGLAAGVSADVVKSGSLEGTAITWVLDSTGTLTFSGTGRIPDYAKTANAPRYDDNGIDIQKIVFESGITHIGSNSFYEYLTLNEIVFPETLQTIGDNAFNKCTALTKITIPENVTTIGQQAFMNCSSLQSATFLGDAPTVYPYSSFENTSANFTIYFYEDKTGWKTPTWQEYRTASLGISPVVSSYTAELSTATSVVTKNEQVVVTIDASSPFSAAEIKLSYNTALLAFNSSASTLHGASVTATNGTLTLVDYGESKSSYIFAFDSIASGIAEVTLTSAAFGNGEDAAVEDLTSAEIENGTVSITIHEPAQEVVLSDILSGASSVEYGKDYTFSIKNYSEYYEYTVSAEMADETALVIDNGSGNYMIENVTGKLDITAAGIPKTFHVIFGTNTGVTLPGDFEIVYGNDYIFSMPAQEHYSTAITQAVYTQSQNNVPYTCENGVVTIQGKDIIDNIKIVINQQLTDAKVTIAGSGADDVSGYKAYAVGGESYTLSVTEDDKYDYTVTAAVNGESVELAKVEGTYTISAEDVKPGAIVFTITKTIKIDAVAVSEYLTLDGNKLWLIKNAVTELDNMVYRYDGTDMFWSDTYEAYCAVVASSEKPEVTANNLSLANGDAVELTDEMDINMSGKIDANDAQFVYNMYNGKYSGITETVTVEKYFRADVNRDGMVNILDAAAVVSHILTQNTRMFFARPAEPSFHFSLEADGSSEKTVHTGDIVTFTFRINRTDSSEDYIMYAMQNEIRYDRTLLELVEDSITVQENVVTNDMRSDEQDRELYINYLSKSRDEVWNADTLVGSFRMKVIGTSGSAEVSCQDSLMSRAGGNGSYPVTYSNVTLEIADVPPVPGDIDGDQQFTESDREYLAKYWAGYPGYSIEDIPLAVLDMDSDGVVTRRDAMILERHFAGWKGYETLPLRQS